MGLLELAQTQPVMRASEPNEVPVKTQDVGLQQRSMDVSPISRERFLSRRILWQEPVAGDRSQRDRGKMARVSSPRRIEATLPSGHGFPDPSILPFRPIGKKFASATPCRLANFLKAIATWIFSESQ
jgi:hypothetical protein